MGYHRRDHVLGSGDLAHRNAITRARRKLLAVRYRLTRAKVDEVGVIAITLHISGYSLEIGF